jgi:hypothetical protein
MILRCAGRHVKRWSESRALCAQREANGARLAAVVDDPMDSSILSVVSVCRVSHSVALYLILTTPR